jgi:hypothetical protein
MAKRSRADKKAKKPPLSTEALAQSQTITNTVVPISFTKQQRKEVQQAIENGMATIRAQANSKSREREKKIKQLQKQLGDNGPTISYESESDNAKVNLAIVLPWSLLSLSWVGLGIYLWLFI